MIWWGINDGTGFHFYNQDTDKKIALFDTFKQCYLYKIKILEMNIITLRIYISNYGYTNDI